MKRFLWTSLMALLVVGVPALAVAEQLEGFKMPDKGKKGVFSPGLIRGYGENQVIPFKANVDAVDLEDARQRAIAEGSASEYLITVMIPTYSDHAPPRSSEANAESECLFGVPVGGDYPHDNPTQNYKDLLVPSEAPQDAKDCLGGGGAFTFGVVAYQPAQGDWEGSNTKRIGTIDQVVNDFSVGHPVFPNGVTGLRYDVHFSIDDSKLPGGRGKQDPPPPACTIQYGVRLAPSGLQPIVPGPGMPDAHPDWGTGAVPGACSFHPGPGMLHAAYEVGKPTGRATVPIVCTFAPCVKLIQVEGVKWNDIALDHSYELGDPVIEGVVIELRSGTCDGDILDSDTTSDLGAYSLMTYVECGQTVRLVVSEDSAGPGETLDNDLWVQTTPRTDCYGNDITAHYFDVGLGVYIEDLENVTQDTTLPGRNFGNIPPQPVCFEGTKWCDLDVDHRYDPGDTVLEGVVIELREGGCDGTLLDSDVTDATGYYRVCTEIRYGNTTDLYIVEDSTGPGQALDPANYWSQTTPQTDCSGEPIPAEWFTVGLGVFIEHEEILGPSTFAGRDFGNARLRTGDVGERTPGFWCSQVMLDQYGQGGSQPCHDTIVQCSGSLIERIQRAIELWTTGICGAGENAGIFDDFVGGGVDLPEAEQILCPQSGDAEKNQLRRHLLALLLNVVDQPCYNPDHCGYVGSPNGLDQQIWLDGRVQSVRDALEAACAGVVGHEVIAAINENRITLVVADCGE